MRIVDNNGNISFVWILLKQIGSRYNVNHMLTNVYSFSEATLKLCPYFSRKCIFFQMKHKKLQWDEYCLFGIRQHTENPANIRKDVFLCKIDETYAAFHAFRPISETKHLSNGFLIDCESIVEILHCLRDYISLVGTC